LEAKLRPGFGRMLSRRCFLISFFACWNAHILTEVLQGIRSEKEYVTTKHQFANLIYLDDDQSTFELGATIYRNLRKQGITICNSIDCLIAATVIQHNVALLENDRDFPFIDSHYPLNLISKGVNS
jgi:predicted nucleic acid-binding protein